MDARLLKDVLEFNIFVYFLLTKIFSTEKVPDIGLQLFKRGEVGGFGLMRNTGKIFVDF